MIHNASNRGAAIYGDLAAELFILPASAATVNEISRDQSQRLWRRPKISSRRTNFNGHRTRTEVRAAARTLLVDKQFVTRVVAQALSTSGCNAGVSYVVSVITNSTPTYAVQELHAAAQRRGSRVGRSSNQ